MDHNHKRILDLEIEELKNMILRMGRMVQVLILNAVDALKELNVTAAQKIITDDEQIDQLELDIDEKSIEMIALRQPEASDLRFLMTGIRITNDLERIGDLAEDIAQRILELKDKPRLKQFPDIPKMAKLADEALSIALDAFINRDGKKARLVWEKEREVDKLRNNVCKELESIMSSDTTSVPWALPLFLVARHLERISDHVTNIVEDIIYMAEGTVVKHSRKK